MYTANGVNVKQYRIVTTILALKRHFIIAIVALFAPLFGGYGMLVIMAAILVSIAEYEELVDSHGYILVTALLVLVVSPLVVSAAAILGALTPISPISPVFPFLAIALIAAFAAFWVWYGRRIDFFDKVSPIVLPFFLSLSYHLLLWIVGFRVSGYSPGTTLYGWLVFGAFPYIFLTIILHHEGYIMLFPFITSAVALVTMAIVLITRAVCRKKMIFDKGLAVIAVLALCLWGTAAYQFHARRPYFVGAWDGVTQRVKTDHAGLYRPFAANNDLAEMPWPPALTFTEDFPRLGGKPIAFPVFAAIAQALYAGLDETTVRQYIRLYGGIHTRIYQIFLNDEIDIFFGADPSGQQREMAEARGVELTMTPIAREAFVFFVHQDNPVNSLTVSQIRSIYRRRLTNWHQAGGTDERILAFQRPGYSNIQAFMLEEVMEGGRISRPLREEWDTRTHGIRTRVAAYRNYTAAIGYSFRYFVTGMRPHNGVKILAVDGIAPTPENIRNGTYPFSVNVYAITAGPVSENTERLIQWILSEQGQAFIELCGIVPLR